MKNIKRFLSIALSLIIILSIATGCSSKSTPMDIESSNDSKYKTSEDYVGVAPGESAPNYSDNEESSPLEPIKVIVRFYLDMQTIEFDKSITNLENLISKYEGYVESSSINLGSYYDQNNYRSANYTIRIPKTNINKFMNETGSVGKINTQEESKEDVTLHYRDTESRLNVLNIKEERILELLKKAEKMEDIIALENSLSDVIYQKENLTGVLKDLDNKIEFSTVSIYLKEVQKINVKDDAKTKFGQRIANAFSNSLHYFKLGFENFIIQFIYALPALIVLAILLYGIYKGTRIYNGKKKSNKNINQDK
jgi:hypothetical protein